MENINEGSKLVAQTIQLLISFDDFYPNHEEIERSIEFLREALDKLTTNM